MAEKKDNSLKIKLTLAGKEIETTSLIFDDEKCCRCDKPFVHIYAPNLSEGEPKLYCEEHFRAAKIESQNID